MIYARISKIGRSRPGYQRLPVAFYAEYNIEIWDVRTQTLVRSLDWSSDGRHIAAGKSDGTVQIWTLPGSP